MMELIGNDLPTPKRGFLKFRRVSLYSDPALSKKSEILKLTESYMNITCNIESRLVSFSIFL